MSEQNRDLGVVIIGAGPAGLSAAIWCRDLGLDAIVLEKARESGGQLLSIYNAITNYPGLKASNGRELRDRFLETANIYGVEIIYSTEVVDIDIESTSLITADGKRFSARSIILATGVRRRRLNIPGESEFIGKGIIESGSRDKESVRGKTVAIIGGGDAALENALILAEYAAKVYVIHRRDRFSARQAFQTRAAALPSVEFIMNAHALAINGNDSVNSIEIVEQGTKRTRSIQTDAVLIRVGVEPNSGLAKNKVSLDRKNYILTDAAASGAPNIYAIGDVGSLVAPTIANAVGTGASVAKRLRDLYDNLHSFQ